MSKIYERFSTHGSLDKKARDSMYMFESTGKPRLLLTDKPVNGYLVGKHWMDATIEMWKQDMCAGLLFRFELEADYPEWFLNKVL